MLFTGTVSVHVLQAELKVRVPTDPRLFRSMLWKRIQQEKVVVYGTCDRTYGKISIDFMVMDHETRTRVAHIILEVAKLCASAVSADVILEEQLSTIRNKLVESSKLALGWMYVRQTGSPAPKIFDPPAPPSPESFLQVPIPEKCRRKARSDGSGSSGGQNAHILFKEGTGYDEPILRILSALDEAEFQRAQGGLAAMQNLTYNMPYSTHQDYDNFRFFYAWRFLRRDLGWALFTQPRFMEQFTGEEPQLLEFSFLSEHDHLKWRNALALRKALTIANRTGKVDTEMFKKDWESDVSSCWLE